MTSEKRIAANRRNAMRSTGPTSIIGKQRARANSSKHSILTRELVIDEKEKVDFDALRNALYSQLSPASALQQIAFDRIVNCCWRLKLAIRLEAKRLQAQLAPPSGDAEIGTSVGNLILSRWFAASNADLLKAIHFLKDVREDIQESGFMHAEDWRESIINAFGAEYYPLITEWATMSPTAIHFAMMLAAKDELLGKAPLPKPNPDSNVQFVVDPQLSWQMAIKIIDFTRLQLESLLQINRLESHKGDRDNGLPLLDLVIRYATSAERGLERAVQWFQDLKIQGF